MAALLMSWGAMPPAFLLEVCGNTVLAMCQHSVKFCCGRVYINVVFSVHLAFKRENHVTANKHYDSCRWFYAPSLIWLVSVSQQYL